MRRSIWWVLAVTVALSVVARWTSPRTGTDEALIDRPAAGPSLARAMAPSFAENQGRPLPERLPDRNLPPAQRDIFAQAPVVQAPPDATPEPEPPPLPEMAPAAPPMNYRFLGRMTDPNGQEQIYLLHEDRSVAIRPGNALSDGYVVKSISVQEIVLTHPPTATEMAISIPAPQGR